MNKETLWINTQPPYAIFQQAGTIQYLLYYIGYYRLVGRATKWMKLDKKGLGW